MSNLWLNIRFGNYYLQIGDPHWYSIHIFSNPYPNGTFIKIIEIYTFFNLIK